MRLVRAISVFCVIGAMPALAAELPSRKPGLWEIKMSFEGRNTPGQTMQQCIDAATDQMMQSSAGPGQTACSKRDVQQSASGITIDSTCTVGGKTTTSHAVITGSFDSAYSMTVTIGQRDRAGRQVDHHDERQVARPLHRRSEARRHDHGQRHEGERSRHAKARRTA